MNSCDKCGKGLRDNVNRLCRCGAPLCKKCFERDSEGNRIAKCGRCNWEGPPLKKDTWHEGKSPEEETKTPTPWAERFGRSLTKFSTKDYMDEDRFNDLMYPDLEDDELNALIMAFEGKE